jgi:hypothetical protein
LYRRVAWAARRGRDEVLLDYESRHTMSENEMARRGPANALESVPQKSDVLRLNRHTPF